MKCNWRRWLWGLIPIAILSWVAVQAEHGRMEHDLTTRTRAALEQGGSIWAAVALKGRDVVLVGRAWDDSQPDRAAETLRNVWGVRAVENRAELSPVVDPYTWTAGRRNHRVRLTGYAPNTPIRQAILGVAKANFPGYEVVDRMSLARGVPAGDAWLAGVSFALKMLTSLKRGDVRLEGLGLSVMGEAEDVAAYRAVKSALANGLPKGIKVINDQVMAPMVSPYTWKAQFAAGRLVLSGHVPSEAGRAEVLGAAKGGPAGTSVVDQMQPGDGAPQGWAPAAAASVRELVRLESGSAEMKDAVLIVAAVSTDEAAAEAARNALRGAMPATIKLTEQIRAREPRRASLDAPAPGRAGEPDAGAGGQPSGGATQWRAEVTPQPEPPKEAKAQAQARACQETLVELTKAGQILFESASAELNAASFGTLDKLAGAVKSCPDMIIQIEGHTDIEGTPDLNQQLSVRRAQSVRSYLVRAGVDAGQLEAVGRGERQPAASNDSTENMARNRRIEFMVRPK